MRGLLPPGLRGAADPIKLTFWSFALQATLREKDRELARGLDAEGKPLRRISAKTRKYRRSAMTPTGKGDPSAPPLTPGRALSRTRSLLTGKAFPDRAEIFWMYDPFTYDSWARVLRRQRRQGRDVFGLSAEGLARVAARSWRDFGRWQQGQGPPPVVPTVAPALPIPTIGTTRMTWATTGIGAVPHPPGAQTTGGLPWEQWLAHLRSPTAPRSNVLLDLIRGTGRPGPPPPPAPPKPGPKPKPPPKPRPKPRPKPEPEPKPPAPPPPPPPPPAWKPGQAIQPGRPIGERIAGAAHLEERRKAIAALPGPDRDAIEALDRQRFALEREITAFVAQGGSPTDPDVILALRDFDRRNLDILRQIEAIQEAGRVRIRRQVASVLDIPADVRASWDHKDGAGFKANVSHAKKRADARDWLEAKTATGPGARAVEITWEARSNARAHASRFQSKILVGDGDPVDAMIHEMGHHIEYRMPGAIEAANEFLAHRVGSQPLENLRQKFGKRYDADEHGRDDDFARAFGAYDAWYVGKHYAQGTTEIIAMGVEKLYDDPVGFAHSDPEYFKFILGILDGSMRKPMP